MRGYVVVYESGKGLGLVKVTEMTGLGPGSVIGVTLIESSDES